MIIRERSIRIEASMGTTLDWESRTVRHAHSAAQGKGILH